ncbi:MAG: LamG-like jellyroll fold domain-containing protein [Chthoniobacteraceae bacterium]
MIKQFPCILLGLIVATITSAHAVQTLGYEFNELIPRNLVGDETIPNSGSVGGDGIFKIGTLGGTGTVVSTGVIQGTAYGDVNLGNTLTLTPNAVGNTNLEAPHIETNAATSLFGFASNKSYTSFAWVNMASSNGDNTVFGGNSDVATGGKVLSLGTRGGDLISGQWDDNVGPDEDAIIPVPNNQWHVIAFTNDGTTGTQTIYLDPGSASEMMASGGTGVFGTFDVAIDLLIGTGGLGGSFSGQLDRITAYDTLRTPAEIAFAATIPEPVTLVALASGTGLLLMRRRRRSSR